MQKELVSFQVAKLAIEKGFDWRAENNYGFLTGVLYDDPVINDLTEEIPTWVAAPTQSLLQRWLREVHNIDILVTTINGRRLERYVSKIYINKLYKKLVGHSVIYEDTFEKGLQEALKLIKNEKGEI